MHSNINKLAVLPDYLGKNEHTQNVVLIILIYLDNK